MRYAVERRRQKSEKGETARRKDLPPLFARDGRGRYCQKGGMTMLRGCQKETIMLKTVESRLFERAFFVLRRGGEGVAEGDMLAEATRILSLAQGERPRRRWGRGLSFAAGMLAGIAIFAIFRFAFGW